MTQEEAIEILDRRTTIPGDGYTFEQINEDIDLAIAALRPVSLERGEKVWRGEWQDMREAYNDVPKRRCSRCKSVFIGLDRPFCDACGAPMTDEAVQMVAMRLEALKDGSTTD